MLDGSKEFFINLDVDSDERFDMAKFMEYLGDNYDPLTSHLFNEVQNIKQGGKYQIQGEDGRPDLLSYRIYGNTQYWWLILIYNGITEFNNFSTGTEISFPQLSALEDFYFSLKIKQTRQDKES